MSIEAKGPKKGRSQDRHEQVSFQENHPCVVWSQKEETKRLRLERQSLARKGVMIVLWKQDIKGRQLQVSKFGEFTMKVVENEVLELGRKNWKEFQEESI